MTRSLAHLETHKELHSNRNWMNPPRFLKEKVKAHGSTTLETLREGLKVPEGKTVINTLDYYQTNYVGFNIDSGYSIFDIYGVGFSSQDTEKAELPMGVGFMITRNLAITLHSILPDKDVAVR